MTENQSVIIVLAAGAAFLAVVIRGIAWRYKAWKLLRDNDRLRDDLARAHADLARITRKTLAERQSRSAASRKGWERRRRG
jgi:hypothetical protein